MRRLLRRTKDVNRLLEDSRGSLARKQDGVSGGDKWLPLPVLTPAIFLGHPRGLL